jgi:hypothetical protein
LLFKSGIVFQVKVMHLRGFIGERHQGYAYGKNLSVPVHAQIIMGVAITGKLVKVQYIVW